MTATLVANEEPGHGQRRHSCSCSQQAPSDQYLLHVGCHDRKEQQRHGDQSDIYRRELAATDAGCLDQLSSPSVANNAMGCSLHRPWAH
jgi:hypothetical protein